MKKMHLTGYKVNAPKNAIRLVTDSTNHVVFVQAISKLLDLLTVNEFAKMSKFYDEVKHEHAAIYIWKTTTND